MLYLKLDSIKKYPNCQSINIRGQVLNFELAYLKLLFILKNITLSRTTTTPLDFIAESRYRP